MNRLIVACAVAAGVVAVSGASGCFSVNANLPGTLRGDLKADQTENVGTLSYEDTHWFFINGLIGSPPEDYFASEIQRQVKAKGGDGVTHLQYEATTGCVDLLFSFCSCSIISPRTYKISGDIVRIKAAPIAGGSMSADAQVAEPVRVAQQY